VFPKDNDQCWWVCLEKLLVLKLAGASEKLVATTLCLCGLCMELDLVPPSDGSPVEGERRWLTPFNCLLVFTLCVSVCMHVCACVCVHAYKCVSPSCEGGRGLCVLMSLRQIYAIWNPTFLLGLPW